MSYSYVIKRLCMELEIEESFVKTLKSKKLIERQRDLFNEITSDVVFTRF